jgi:hypothetical protein
VSYITDIEIEVQVIKGKAEEQPAEAIDMLADLVLRLARRIEE